MKTPFQLTLEGAISIKENLGIWNLLVCNDRNNNDNNHDCNGNNYKDSYVRKALGVWYTGYHMHHTCTHVS